MIPKKKFWRFENFRTFIYVFYVGIVLAIGTDLPHADEGAGAWWLRVGVQIGLSIVLFVIMWWERKALVKGFLREVEYHKDRATQQ